MTTDSPPPIGIDTHVVPFGQLVRTYAPFTHWANCPFIHPMNPMEQLCEDVSTAPTVGDAAATLVGSLDTVLVTLARSESEPTRLHGLFQRLRFVFSLLE